MSSLALSGDTLYVGGNFSYTGGATRQHLAAVDTVSGAATSWEPGPNWQVYAVEVDGSGVLAAGEFTTLSGEVRNHLAKLDATGQLVSWDPALNENVYALAVCGAPNYSCLSGSWLLF